MNSVFNVGKLLRRGHCMIWIIQLVALRRQQVRQQEVAGLLQQGLLRAMRQQEQLLEQERHLLELQLEPVPLLEELVVQRAHQQVVAVALPEPYHRP